MTPEVDRYLHAHLEMLRQLVAARRGVEDGLLFASGALAALREVGAVTEAEAREWCEQVTDEMGLRPGATHPAARPLHPHGVSGGGRSFIYAAGTPKPESFGEPAIPRFLHLVPGPDDEVLIRGARLRFIGVEVYDVGIGLQWRAEHHGTVPGVDISEVLDALRLTDDTGVEYTLRSYHASHSGTWSMGQLGGWPGIPVTATELLAELEGMTVRIPLSRG